MDYSQAIAAYKQLVQNAVGTKTEINSIDPTDVASIGLELATFLLNPLNTINNFNKFGGDVPPDNTNGIDLDTYTEINSNYTHYTKRNGIWSQDFSVPLGFTFGSGNITLQASVFGQVLSVSAGKWSVNNVIYSKATQTQLNLTAADANFNRIDLVYANSSGVIDLLDGVASPTPNEPVTPANSIIVAYVYVPSISSGELPYIADSNSMPPTANEKRTGYYAIPDTGQAIITIPHGYTTKPSHADAFANNAAAGALSISWKDWDETNIYLTLGFSQNDGQSLKYAWEATL